MPSYEVVSERRYDDQPGFIVRNHRGSTTITQLKDNRSLYKATAGACHPQGGEVVERVPGPGNMRPRRKALPAEKAFAPVGT